MLKKLFYILLLMLALGFVQSAWGQTGSTVSAADAKEILDHHNKARKDLGIPPLTWSPKLAKYAQVWADSLAGDDCKFEHRESGLYGENIFMSSPSQEFQPIQASMAWYEEKEKYTYAKVGEGDADEAGHYTQMIWKKTKAMGAGMATCANGNIIIVANYDPAGNMSGEYPYDK